MDVRRPTEGQDDPILVSLDPLRAALPSAERSDSDYGREDDDADAVPQAAPENPELPEAITVLTNDIDTVVTWEAVVASGTSDSGTRTTISQTFERCIESFAKFILALGKEDSWVVRLSQVDIESVWEEYSRLTV